MRNRGEWTWMLAAALFGANQEAAAQQTTAPLASPDYTPPRTAWGDPDFRGTWPAGRIVQAGIPFERQEAYGDRQSMTDEEFTLRLDAARESDARYANELVPTGSVGLAEWLRSTPFGRRTSLLVNPANGRLPSLTPHAEALHKAGRVSWNDGQPIDWVTDLGAYDRCISRGFPATMFPYGGDTGIRVFQSPGFVVLQLEVLGTRIVPVGHGERWPEAVRGWLGQSRGRWEGATLVIETTNLVAGDSASTDVTKRAAPPVPSQSGTKVPTSAKATATERLTMTGPDTISYEVTYRDPEVFTAPWTAQLEWTRDTGYRLHEYACHEGNSIRYMITGSRAQRKEGVAGAGSRPEDSSGRWPFPASGDANVEQAGPGAR